VDALIPGFGRYQLLKRLGAGGMAEVFLARAATGQLLERPVVIKRLLPHLNHNDHFTRMFLDEVRISASLQHANIVQVFDFGRIEQQYYLALEWIFGRSLYDVISKLKVTGQRMPVPVTVAIAIDVCKALGYAHGRKDASGKPLAIVHRDVSPSNILLSFEGEVKLADFGIARAADRLMETQSGSLKGKASYMAPEQVRGQPATPLSDQFALGIVLYEALAMRALFTGLNPMETLARVQKADVPPLSEVRPGIPRDLERIVMRMLATYPNRRFRSERDVSSDLEKVQHALPPADVRGFMRGLFKDELARDETEFQQLFTRARAQEAEALWLRMMGVDAPELERRYGDPSQAQSVFVPADEPKPLGARVHLILESQDGAACMRVEGQVVDHAEGGMVVRPLPAPLLPQGRDETDATAAGDEWLSAIERRTRRRWIAPVFIAATAIMISIAALVAQKQWKARNTREALAAIGESIRGGNLKDAGDRLLAAKGKFPDGPEIRQLQAALVAKIDESARAALVANRFDDALALYDRRASFALPDGASTSAQQLARTGAFAVKAGMVHAGDFWIDRYEYPNVAGAPPLTHVDWQAAADLCQRAGKRLCTESEWEQACAGTEKRAYPYGDRFRADACVALGKTDRPQPAGSRPACTTPAGINDLSGNVAEWTATPFKPGGPQKAVRGGDWEQAGIQVSCQARDYFLPGQGGTNRIGFRCCR
jgi:tRNA A-37 threonylcarbamoyl transferase component Bud32